MPGKIGRFKVSRTIGSGGSCKVKLGRDSETGENVAVKIMKDDMDADDLKLVLTEVESLRSVEHENVIRVLECGEGEYEKPSGKKRVNYIIV